MENKNNDSKKLFMFGAAILAVGLFFGYGVAIFFGAALMIAGILPPSGDENDPV